MIKGYAFRIGSIVMATAVASGAAGLLGRSSGSPQLSDRLQDIEAAWQSDVSLGLKLTPTNSVGSEVSGLTVVDGDHIAWQVPTIGRVSVGQAISISSAGSSSPTHVVTGIGVIDGRRSISADGRSAVRSLVLTLRAGPDGAAGEPVRMIVSGTPLGIPAAHGGHQDKAL